jgi:hypothetical protein
MSILSEKNLNYKTLFFVAIISVLIVILYSRAYAHGDISSFNTDITVTEDGTLHIKDTIVATYSKEVHYNIYRTTPFLVRNASTSNIQCKVNSVTDEQGNDWWYKESCSDQYLEIGAGNPDVYGNHPKTTEKDYQKTFIIDYEMTGIVFQEDSYNEISWMVFDNAWETIPIITATAIIRFPEEISSSDLKGECYTGKYDRSSEQKCESEVIGNEIHYRTTEELGSNEELNIVAEFPENVESPLTYTQQTAWSPTDNWLYKLPMLVFFELYYP